MAGLLNSRNVIMAPAGLMQRMALFVGLIALSSLSLAQSVVVDNFSQSHVINATETAPSVTTQVSDAGSILGTQRDVRVEFINGGAGQQTTSNAGAGTLGHGETDNSRGRSIITWDGTDASADGATLDGSNNVTGGGIATTGLGGVNFSGNCASPNPGFSIGASASDNDNEYSITLNVYSSDSAWSTLTRTKAAGSAAEILTFPFNSFSAQGNSNADGANFESVGAIELIIDVTGVGTDMSIFTPVAGCEFDFGDSPEAETAGGSFRAYTTTVGVKGDFNGGAQPVANNTERGPHALINGPWMPDFAAAVGTNNTDAETNGQNTPNADGDDAADANNDAINDDEAGVNLPPMPRGDTAIDPNLGPVECDGLAMGPSEYCAAVRVANPTSSDAQMFAFIDFDGSGVYDVEGCSDASGDVVSSTLGTPAVQGCERSAAQVRIGDTGLANLGGTCSASSAGNGDTLGGTSFMTGNVPANCEGKVILVWNLANATTVTTNATYSRFRITTDTDETRSNYFNDSPGPEPFNLQLDGEIEDHLIDAGTLPVSIHAFESRYTDSGLTVEWGTVSETRNAGFYLWGDFGDGPELLMEQPIGSRALDAASSQRYSVTIPGLSRGAVSDLIVTAVDTEGNEAVFGMFEPGKAYGRKSDPLPIAWGAIRQQVSARMAERAYAERQRSQASGAAANFMRAAAAKPIVVAVDFKVSSEGMQQVTWQDLRDAGLDLTGVANERIAVTLDGEPVARHVLGAVDSAPIRSLSRAGNNSGPPTSAEFGPGGKIRFWGLKPDGRDALYLDDYVYRISVDPELAVGSNSINVKPKPGAEFHLQRELLNEDLAYSFTSALDDPWFAARLRADSSNDEYTGTIEVDQWLVSDQPARLEVVLTGGNNSPTSPNHHAQILVNGQVIDDVFFTGSIEQRLSFEVPAGLIQPGDNTVSVAAPGGTDAQFDIVVVDRIALSYPRRLRAVSNRLLVERALDEGGVTAHGFTTLDTVAYAWDGEALSELNRSQFSRGSVRVPTVESDDASYWISAEREMHRPEVVLAVGPNELLDGASGDLVIIAHPAFLPLDGNEPHPLNDYIADRINAGWNPVLFDISEIQTYYGHGMALPQAVNRFLADADAAFEFEHVLLVGSDSYDYTDNLGLGSLSFIPTHYAETRFISYTPSDALLTDLDGDGLSDKSVGRWPVRTMSDLAATVTKTLDWAGGAVHERSAVWVTDSEDPSVPSFRSQAERMFSVLTEAGWPETGLNGVFWADVEPAPGVSVADAARAAFFGMLEQGRSLTGFSGHGAPSMWTFQGLLIPDDLAELHNEGTPTLIGTMTCYTSYFVSPFTDTVAHRWMNGYREDAAGNQIPGVPNGAVAIHGAATLSNYAQNEVFARNVLQYQLDGLTLGEAVQQARVAARSRGIEDLVINWTLLGDPTLRIGSAQ